jgi:mannonate dehydratase
MLTRENFKFARQAGATHIVAHLVDYFRDSNGTVRDCQPTGGDCGWGRAGDPDKLWTTDELKSLRKEVEAEGLKLEAIENFDPAHWHDVLLDGPGNKQQLDNLKQIVRSLGEAGIPIMGYNFSIAGVCGRTTGPYARGGAMSVGMEGPLDEPMPKGMVWNMVYDANAPRGTAPTVSATVSGSAGPLSQPRKQP